MLNRIDPKVLPAVAPPISSAIVPATRAESKRQAEAPSPLAPQPPLVGARGFQAPTRAPGGLPMGPWRFAQVGEKDAGARLDATTSPVAKGADDVHHRLETLVLDGVDHAPLAAALDAHPVFREMREKNSVQAISFLFRSPDLPGETAQDRLQFVLAYLASDGLPYRVLIPHAGFKDEFQDGNVWPGSKQGGHFLTAVQLGASGGLYRDYIAKPAAIGHERVGDRPGLLNYVRQGLAGFGGGSLRRFDRAVEAARGGHLHQVIAICRLLTDAPETRAQALAQPDRVGNSQQDLRLTVYGWLLGEMIRKGELATGADVAAWIDRKIADPMTPKVAEPRGLHDEVHYKTWLYELLGADMAARASAVIP